MAAVSKTNVGFDFMFSAQPGIKVASKTAGD